jgi:hypothetical protein
MASTYLELPDGSFEFNGFVSAADVLPDGSIRLPEPETPLKGLGSHVSRLPTREKKQPAALNLTDREYHALPSANAARTAVSTAEPDTAVRRKPGRQKGDGRFVGHELEVMEHVKALVKKWRITAQEKDASLKDDPSPKDICTTSTWVSIASSFPFPPGVSSLYKCLKVYGRAIGQPWIVWKNFLESIPQ